MRGYPDPPDRPDPLALADLLDLLDSLDPRDLADRLAQMVTPAQRVTLASLGLQVYRAMWARTDLEDRQARQDDRAFRDRYPPSFPAPPGTRPGR